MRRPSVQNFSDTDKVILVVVVAIGLVAIALTWSDASSTTCYVPDGQRMVLYGGEGNKARILPPGEHPFAGYAYEDDYLVAVGSPISTTFDVREDQGSVAGVGHLLARNRWTKDTILGETAQVVTPQPTYITVQLTYTLSDESLDRLVADSNDAPFEQTIMPKLLLKAFSRAKEKMISEQGVAVRAWNWVRRSEVEIVEDQTGKIEERMREILAKEFAARYEIELVALSFLGIEKRDIGEDEPIRPMHLAAHRAPPSARIQNAPTVFGAFMGNIGKILIFIVTVFAVAFWESVF